jgi:hypothetical protein
MQPTLKYYRRLNGASKMWFVFARGFAALLLLLSANTLLPGVAPAAEKHELWPLTMRQVEPARQIVVVVVQSDITTTHRILPPGSPGGCSGCRGGVAPALIGSIIGGLIANKLGAAQQKKDQEFLDVIATMSDTLKDFNFDSSVATATEEMVMGAPWLGATPVQISKEETNASFSQLLESSESSQILALRYTYQLIRELTALEIDTDIALIDKGSPLKGKPGKRTSFDTALFLRHIHYVVPLEMPAGDALGNAKIWAQDNAKLLRKALEAVIAKSVSINAKAITLTPEDAAALNSVPRTKEGVGWKRSIDEDKEGELFADSNSTWTYRFAPVGPPPTDTLSGSVR